jgi:succinyl-diaminopimelate desuccinylase
MLDVLLAHLDEAYTLNLLKQLIAIPSVIGQEQTVAEFIEAELRSLGLETTLQMVEAGRPNVLARLPGDGPGKRLHFNGHTDTVPVVAGWETDPFTALEDEGRLYGLGSCDMKAGLACAMSMLRAFVRSRYRFPGELSFSAVIDEEAYGKGAHALMETDFRHVDAILVMEPFAGDEAGPLPLGITGKVLYDIHVYGRAAHAFHPQAGVNAIEAAGRILANLDRLALTEHPTFGKGNYSTLKIEGGYEIYSVVVPEYCRLEVNRLLVPGETSDSAVRDMEELIASLNLPVRVEVKTKPPRYEAYAIDRQSPPVELLAAVYNEVFGHLPRFQYAYGITDANIYAGEHQIPCLHLGPPASVPHQKNEYVLIDWLGPITRAYAIFAARFLS